MKTKNSAVLAGVAALGIAGAILGVSILAGVPVLSTLVRTAGPGTPGTLSVLLTDPPNVPEGVSAVFVTYSNLEIHVSEAGNWSGWTQVSSGGTINLLSTVNVSRTVAAARVPTGDYNAIRLNVTSAQVTYDGKNYSSFVVKARLFVPILEGGIEVNDSKPSATIIDISPLVMNIGSSSTPEFVIRTTAVAFPVPSSQVTEDMERQGFTFGLAGRDWWERLDQSATASLRVTGAALAPTSLNVSVEDGSQNTAVRLVIVSPIATMTGGEAADRMPTELLGTAVFVVEANGTLVPFRQFFATVMASGGDGLEEMRQAFTGEGFNMTAGASASFSYSGQIELGFSFGGLVAHSVVAGQQYLITVIGEGALASHVVAAT